MFEISFLQKIPRENFHAKRLHMNERIRDLMIKADYPAPELALRAQALVELIVLECAKVADDGWADPGHQIKQHFGVEE